MTVKLENYFQTTARPWLRKSRQEHTLHIFLVSFACCTAGWIAMMVTFSKDFFPGYMFGTGVMLFVLNLLIASKRIPWGEKEIAKRRHDAVLIGFASSLGPVLIISLAT